ncbi:HYC_CC_PP family protein [Aestuariivivens sediminicola]|uniref:HYC_CC_PP family protein n=1 Tax=Aestuariivivens sediminicola TaxID=2913560 RepID=UPI001F576438
MTKTILHKVFSVFMALAVLFSTVSFTVEKHFCGDVLIDMSIFTDVEKCAMASFEMERSNIAEMPCCKDIVEVVKGQDELKTTTFEDLNLAKQFFIHSYLYAYLRLFEALPGQVIPHKDYSPPNLIKDIQVLDQIFII